MRRLSVLYIFWTYFSSMWLIFYAVTDKDIFAWMAVISLLSNLCGNTFEIACAIERNSKEQGNG